MVIHTGIAGVDCQWLCGAYITVCSTI